MTDAWDGRPENPEVAAWHWLKRRGYGNIVDGGRCALWWSAIDQHWRQNPEYGVQNRTYVAFHYIYEAPLTPPAEVAALRADNERLREALGEMVTTFYDAGCHICGGDCASANPPVGGCPVRVIERARAALSEPAP